MQTADLPELLTPRLRLVHAHPGLARSFAQFMARNESHLRRWDPPHPPGIATSRYWRSQLGAAVREFRGGTSLRWALLDRAADPAASPHLVGRINFSQVVRGVSFSCVVGYQLDAAAEGKGLMLEAMRAALADLFETRGLHRVQAAYLPENARSARLLERLGFERIGVSRRYLFIDGAWRDHVLAALVSPAFDDTRFAARPPQAARPPRVRRSASARSRARSR
jgi:ribosomal-protein-alanine N-acetyltransferase